MQDEHEMPELQGSRISQREALGLIGTQARLMPEEIYPLGLAGRVQDQAAGLVVNVAWDLHTPYPSFTVTFGRVVVSGLLEYQLSFLGVAA
ncbi:hypothetical protein [Alkalilimnicola sp. S0819]|uniref:hypothetical protein n=1 Tax=Alkalilimnicola sp. S0819 TaxID=2613922 RepID=UPI0012623054|nr:hypothetical protein [Alkalilimnicola sp. S0819]KAB7624355.1 hypothetical protein F3N43_05985 [Alkalilimnicola sp. S0819]MPQ16181.1 hypothetical protein [Alkalilimnicola sp. S0819]